MDRSVICALLALALAACGRPETGEAPAGAAPVDTTAGAATEAAVEVTTECVNPAEGYAVRYPASWHVNTGEILGPCALFDPEPIEVPRDSEVPIEIAVMIDMEPVPFTSVAGDVLGRREISRERTTVDGREAVRIEAETTGEGLHPPGIRFYQYLADLGDTTMIAVTYDAGTLPFERRRRVLDAMMSNFDFQRAD